jgi:uncharacterized protein (TIGR02594 family)
MSKIPNRFAYLQQVPLAPLMVRLAMDLHGTLESPGTPDNPTILGWADQVNNAYNSTYNKWAADWYNDDAVPWCGLFMAAICARTGLSYRAPPKNYLAALSWADWGEPVQWKDRNGLRLENIHVGDVGVLVRKGGGHVGIIVGVTKDGKNIIMIGGNQGDKVSFAEFPLERLYAVRRPVYRDIPKSARHVRVDSTGVVSKTEQ